MLPAAHSAATARREIPPQGDAPSPKPSDLEHVAPPSPRTQRGQAAIFTIVALTTLIGMVALVIDVGIWRTERGHMQNAADAAALAGAARLNQGAAAAQQFAYDTATANGATGATAVA